MRVASGRSAVTGDGAVGICLVDVVVGRAACGVGVSLEVVAGPGIIGVAAGGGVRGAAQIQSGKRLTLYTQTLSSGRVRVAIVGHAVTGDGAVGICLVDVVIDSAVAVVVVGGAGKAPGVAEVAARIGVRGAAHVDAADRRSRLTIDAADGVGRRVREAVIRHAVRRDIDHRIGLVNLARTAGGGRQDIVARQSARAWCEIAGH